MNRLTHAHADALGVNLDAYIDNYGVSALLRRKTTEEDLYGDKEEEWIEVNRLMFLLRLPDQASIVGAAMNVFTEEGLPSGGYFRSRDDVHTGDVVELTYPVDVNGEICKYFEIVRLLHRYGTIIVYELGTYKGEFDEY